MARRKIEGSVKIQAVLALLRKEEPASAIARRYEVSEQALHKWKDLFLEEGKRGLEGKTGDKKEIKRLEKELKDRETLIANLSVANYVLKKNWKDDARCCGENSCN